MSVEQEITRGLAEHWVLLVAGFGGWQWWQKERRDRREEGREERQEQRVAIGAVVAEALAAHTSEEEKKFSSFAGELKQGIAGITELLRQHDTRLRELELRK